MSEPAGDTGRRTETLELRNDLAELSRLAEWLHAEAGHMQLPLEVLSDIDHCAAEAVHNVIAYAYGDMGEHLIQIRLERKSDRVSLEIEDDGAPFNPLEYPSPPRVLRLEQASLGGHGIRIMIGLMTECRYRRQDGRNVLTMVRVWK